MGGQRGVQAQVGAVAPRLAGVGISGAPAARREHDNLVVCGDVIHRRLRAQVAEVAAPPHLGVAQVHGLQREIQAGLAVGAIGELVERGSDKAVAIVGVDAVVCVELVQQTDHRIGAGIARIAARAGRQRGVGARGGVEAHRVVAQPAADRQPRGQFPMRLHVLGEVVDGVVLVVAQRALHAEIVDKTLAVFVHAAVAQARG